MKKPRGILSCVTWREERLTGLRAIVAWLGAAGGQGGAWFLTSGLPSQPGGTPPALWGAFFAIHALPMLIGALIGWLVASAALRRKVTVGFNSDGFTVRFGWRGREFDFDRMTSGFELLLPDEVENRVFRDPRLQRENEFLFSKRRIIAFLYGGDLFVLPGGDLHKIRAEKTHRKLSFALDQARAARGPDWA